MTTTRVVSNSAAAALLLVATTVTAQRVDRAAGAARSEFVPVTDAMLRDPDPADWLMYSRTYDSHRFSPLRQIDRSNVAALELEWSMPLPDGVVEVVPLVYRGVMYAIAPPAEPGRQSAVMALDATNGDVLWSHVPEGQGASRIKSLAIYRDMIFYTAPAAAGELNPVIALDARTGAVRWSTPVTRETHTAGAIVADGIVVSGRTCNSARENCYIAAHDALTGKEAWRFYTAPDAGEPEDETWGGVPPSQRRTASWGLPGSYDPARGLVYWGIANPMPNTRLDRHGGNRNAIPATAPAELYSNSTVALDVKTGRLAWYYQHLPGDSWDMDINNDKTLIRTVIDPDPRHVKWINPDVPKGVERDVVITVGEGGGVWVNDRDTGQFLWAMPFPYDTPNFILSDIDVKTGKTQINMDLVFEKPGDRNTICFWNTRSYWPTSYHPRLNSLFVPYVDHCLDMTAGTPGGEGDRRNSVRRPGSDPTKYAGLARIDMTTGEIHRFHEQQAGGNGAMLTTAGDVVFWGDIMQALYAFDAETGEKLWQSEPLGAPVQTSTITYAVEGKQYVAVINSNALIPPSRIADTGGVTLPPRKGNSINVFALPN
jgi:alcohol dehydrogenase (cytochrome c)